MRRAKDHRRRARTVVVSPPDPKWQAASSLLQVRAALDYEDSMSAEAQPQAQTLQPVRLEDYRPPDYLVDEIELQVRLEPATTEVQARLVMRRNPAAGEAIGPLMLDGQELELIEL